MKWSDFSVAAASLVRDLIPGLNDLTANAGHVFDRLEALGALQDPATIPVVLSFLNSANPAVARKAASLVPSLLGYVAPERLLALDGLIRGGYDYRSGDLHQSEINRFDFAENTAAVLALLSCHWNGFVREAALRRLLRDYPEGDIIPFLLLRLDDWVPSVRNLAENALELRFTAQNRDSYLKQLPLILQIQQRMRGGRTAIFARIQRLLQSEPLPLLESVLTQNDPATRRAGIAWAWEAARNGDCNLQTAVLKRILQTQDPALHLRVATWCTSGLFSANLESQILPPLLNDPYSVVRRKVTAWCATQDPQAYRSNLYAALLSRNATMRSIGQFYLRRLEDIDLPRFYREEVGRNHEQTLQAAVAGLGETGSQSDADLVAPLVTFSAIRLRKVALAALGRLNPKKYRATFITALRDDSSRISRMAREYLEPQVFEIGAEKLAAILREEKRAHVRRQVIALAARLPKWQAVSLLIEFHKGEDVIVRSLVETSLQAWIQDFNRTHQVQPTTMEIERIRAMLTRAGQSLPSSISDKISFLLDSLH